MNITSTITSSVQQLMIPSDPSGKRKVSDDNSSTSNAPPKPKRPRKDYGATNKRKLLSGEEQRGGLVIIRGAAHSSQPSSQPSSDTNNALAGPSQPPAKRFRATTTPTPAPAPAPAPTKGRHKPTDDDSAVEADARRMEQEADALRRAGHRSPDALIPLAPRETPQIEQNRTMRGEGARTPSHARRGSVSRGKRLSNSFDRTGVITQPHASVDDASLYKHIDAELPDPDRARQLVLLCAARAPLPAPREGKDPPSQPSEQGVKLLQDLRDDVMLLLAERKIEVNVMGAFQPESSGSADVRANEQNVRNRARTARFKDEIRLAKAEDDAWAATAHFYNSYQEPVLRELEQRQKAKGKQRADPEEGLRISDLPKQFRGASDLALSVLARDASGEHNPLTHRWSELLYRTDHLHSLVNPAVQLTNAATTDLDQRFAHLSTALHAHTQRPPLPAPTPTPTQSTPALATYLPPRPATAASDPHNLLRALARVDAARPPAQLGAAASRAAREVLRAQDAPPASARRITPVAPPTPRTPRRPGTPGRGR
ncbi:hypothetical protein BC834DRAFT_1044616 [Gloeopeniophorella convolvens]|nr:hypothetical protein BC834DRAFT_1044616 [Gloeopeniophorella convolvens]